MKKLVIILGFCTYGFFLNAQGIIRYVTPNGNPATEGNDTNAISWTAACNDLQAVINASDSGDQVWVGTGTYMPIRPANNLLVVDSFNRNNAFVLKNGVALYGGFDGVETSIEERTLAVNGIGSNGKNCPHRWEQLIRHIM